MARRVEGWWRGVVLLAGLLIAGPLAGHAVQTTTVQDTVYRADGGIAQGTLLVSWSAFTAADGSTIAAGSTMVTMTSTGGVTLQLVPNAGAQPVGSYYTAVYHLTDGTVQKEYWVVPQLPTVTIAMMRSKVVPAAVAESSMNQQMVNTAVNTALGAYLPLKGGALSGTLSLASDPVSGLQAATKQYVDAHVSSGTTLSLPNQTDVLVNNGAGKPTDLPERGVSVDATGKATVAWSEDYLNGVFDCRNPKYGSGGCLGPNPAQAMQDLASAMICYGATTGKHPTTYFPPGTFKVGLPSKPALIFPAGGNYYGAGQSLNGGGTVFQATYNNSYALQWNTGQTATCSDGLVHTSNISGGTITGIGEHGCAEGGCIATPGDTNDYLSGGGPRQGGMFIGDSQGNVSFLSAKSNGGFGIHVDGQDTRATHLWGASNTSWWIGGKYATHIAVPVAGTPTTSTTGGTLAAGTYYYKVTATGNAIVGGAGETTGSVEKSVTTTGTTSSVSLSWPAVTNATGYKVYRGTAAGGENVYYTTTTNSFTDTGASATGGGAVPTASTATYNPAGDGFHGSIESFNYDGQTDYVENYGRFDAAGAEYGHIAGLLAVGGAASYSHIFNQLDEIGVMIPFGNDGLRLTHFRIDAPHGDGIVVNANAILTDGTILNDCQDSGILALNSGHCSGINSGLGTYMSQISHQLASGIFGPEHSTGFIYGAGHIGSNVDGPIQDQTGHADLPYVGFVLPKSFAGENGNNVTGPSPDVSFANGMHPNDTSPIGYTQVKNAMNGQGLYVKADNANVTLLGPGSGGHWHNCNGGNLNLGLSGAMLHYTAVAGLYGGEELYEQCDPPKNLTARPVPATSTEACNDADFTFGAGPASVGGFGMYRCHPANTWTFYAMTPITF